MSTRPARAGRGTERLQKILNAMSEANRTEQLIENMPNRKSFAPGTGSGDSTVRKRMPVPGRRRGFSNSIDQLRWQRNDQRVHRSW